ncbi:urease accessory UreF family protein [Bradyrhizobium sp. UFLA05-153]|uniref:urease accessory protein UreF n=1 Tax=Bradyrhizobium sp. Ec3.3 TaxID=189753 RepID=UPI001FD930E0|nr:urease accessory UreF family protein [Bradyrhizobium sp. Ec3.3]
MRLQTWLSPTFPIGAYSYSHGLEWAVEAGDVDGRDSLIEWLEADLCYGSVRNEAIFFSQAHHCAVANDHTRLAQVAELAAASRGTYEFSLEASQQAAACLTMLQQMWPDPMLDALSKMPVFPILAVVLGVRSAKEQISLDIALPAFMHSYAANLVTAGIRLIPLGQTDGQFAIAALERAVLSASLCARNASLEEIGSAGVMVELSSILHETQYTRLFRS